MTGTVDLNPNHLATVEAILAEHVPECEVRAFGSRATWTARDYSDLDLAVVGEGPLDWRTLSRLKEAFEESNLPMRVDVLDWHAISESFRNVIEQNYSILQKREHVGRVGAAGERRGVNLREVIDLTLSSVDKKSKADESAVRLCNYTDVYNSSFIRADMDFMEATATEREISRCSLKTGDVVVTKDSETYDDIGVPALVREDIPDLVCGYHLAILRPSPSKLDGAYLFYALSTNEAQRQFHSYANGITRFGLRKADIGLVEIPLPPLPEQRAIAHVLGTLDDKIELNRRMNETLEEMARALFKSWFVDFEPVRAKMEGRWRPGESLPGLPADLYDLFPDRLVDSELGEMPEGWEVRALGAMVEQLRDNENPQASPNATFSHFSIPAFDQGEVPIQEYGSDIKSAKTRLQRGVVLVSKLNPEIERVWLVDIEADERAVCSTEFLVLHARPPFQRSYVYCLARSPLFREQVESLVTGTSKSHQRAQANAVLSVRVIYPSEPAVHAFGQQAAPLLDGVLAYRKEAIILAAQRDALLPGLVSGEVGVRNHSVMLQDAVR